MARARNIKPGFFRNADLIEMAPLVRILFAGLWTLADREGRLQDRPKQIKMDVLPGDDLDVDSALNELQKAGFIHRYEACGKRVIAILNFGKHQNPHCKEPASELPAPEEHSASTVQAQCKHGAGTEVAGLIPDSLIPDSLSGAAQAPQVAEPSDAAATPPPTKERASRGTRLPADWKLPKAWGEWAVDEFALPADHVRQTAERFADYWHAKAGRDAAKLDWQATWRNWVREDVSRAPAQRKASTSSPFAGAL